MEQTSKPLHRMFEEIPKNYDLINHVITLGMDTGWRKRAAQTCLSTLPGRILDICCGTGDLSITLSQLADYRPEITGVDFSRLMLDEAEKKAPLKSPGSSIRFIEADISNLPFPDNHFDCVCISFAFRNLTYRNPRTPEYLKEVLRVLKPGGRFVIVESAQPESSFIRFFFRLYLRCWVFPAGYLISGNKGAYKYLASSAENFYSPEEIVEFLAGAGFIQASARRLFFGASAIYTALK
ncbi:MAG: bifunctional demethylmenaquinone methyltransferase/2-methoxy-6-polyprenyl-1,4-benzoquinol methylase UbiE [Dehalococcoidia bacterium]|nr:bifunctional demethylmenaquinone methyltransferase/2-methoxy-6-polyprenyl-1,4-benzoquinol methylase UbiE [Dehalococcoidia bacterium]